MGLAFYFAHFVLAKLRDWSNSVFIGAEFYYEYLDLERKYLNSRISYCCNVNDTDFSLLVMDLSLKDTYFLHFRFRYPNSRNMHYVIYLLFRFPFSSILPITEAMYTCLPRLANRVIHVGLSSPSARADPELQRSLAAAQAQLQAAAPAPGARASRLPDWKDTTAKVGERRCSPS